MKTRKRISLWAFDNSIMVEDGNRDAFYEHPTPATYGRFEQLTWHARARGYVVSAGTSTDGLLFVSIDREATP